MGRLRFVRIALLAVVLLAGGLIVVIWSTTFVQTRFAGWALGSLQQRFGIVGHATRVELDLSRLALTVEGLSLATEDHLDQPFFTVDHARVDLPWSSLWSDFSLQEVAFVHPQVTVVTAADGVSNLPSGGNEKDGDFAGPPAQVSIGSLDVRDLTVDWQDDAIPMRLAIGPATLSLTSEGARIAGPLHHDGGAVLEVAGQQLAVDEAEGRLTFDGSSLGLDQLTLRAAVAARVSGEAAGAVTITAEIRGSPNELSAAVTIDGRFLLSCDALRECQETMAPSLAEDSRERELSGRLDAELTLAGPLGDPSATGSITASDVVVFGLPPLTVVTQASVGTTSLDIASEEIRLGDNTLRAQGRLVWDS